MANAATELDREDNEMSAVPTPALLSYQSATADFLAGRDTPRDFLERSLERLDEWEPRLRAFASLALSRARIAADAATARWRAGTPRSHVDGMPVGVKDVLDTRDMPTGMGSPTLAGHRPWYDSAAVLALRDAGAAVVGKTKTTELAMTFPADTRNPHDLSRTPGGSSSGSAAAVGAGVLPVALGTQVIGSVIRPASFCGVFGYKPTSGAINRGGSRDFQSRSCIGFLGASLADVWYTATEIAARVGGDPGEPGLFGTTVLPSPAKPRVLVLLETEGWDTVGEQARDRLDRFVKDRAKAGVTILDRHNDDGVAALENALAAALDKARQILNYETRWLVDALADRDPAGLSQTILTRIDAARSLTPDDYRALLRWREDLRATFDNLMRDADAVVTLSAPGKAPAGLAGTGNATLAVPSSLLGAPAVSLPVFHEDGLPVGLQLIGGGHRDEQLLAIARWAGDQVAHQAS